VLPRDPVWITADAERLERAIFNLLDNARKYTPVGGHIRLTLQSESSERVISIADDGPGIPLGDQERIFDRFYQGQASSRNAGSGLGLPIARAVVQLHGGRLQVDSTPGAGSCFRISLPSSSPQPAPLARMRER
jgi:signal transduction histidine kinase